MEIRSYYTDYKSLFDKDIEIQNLKVQMNIIEETRNKMSKNHVDVSGENNPNYGKRGELSPLFGRHHSEETKEKIRQGNIEKKSIR